MFRLDSEFFLFDVLFFFFFSSRRRHTRSTRDWSSDVCSSDLCPDEIESPDYQQALTILQESAGKAADNPEIQFHLGMTAYMMGQTDLARVAFQIGRASCRERV